MMKFLYISYLIILIPLFRIRYKKLVLAFANTSFMPVSKLFAGIELKMLKDKQSQFLKLFLKHFDIEKGDFADKNVRFKVHDLLIHTLEQGSNYQSLYRRCASSLNPDTAHHGALTRSELHNVFSYFKNHFTHPNDL